MGGAGDERVGRSLLQGQADASRWRYQRHRFYDPSTGQFTPEDPIGLAGGRNLYAFAGGDPINFRDPFGLCPCVVGYALFELGASLYDAYDLAKTGVAYLRGQASGAELSVTAAGAALGMVTVGGGYGKAARLASDYTNVTKRSARVWNRATQVNADQFTEGLLGSGYARTVHADGIVNFTKGDRRYVLRGPERSNSGWTADVYIDGVLTGKLRLDRSP